MSQRELAAAAGVPPSTVGRIESGETTDPGIGAMGQLLAAADLRLAAVDANGREVELASDPRTDREWDRAGRRFPPHLPTYEVTEFMDGWWGWLHIAWVMSDPKVPRLTYFQRPKPRGGQTPRTRSS